ncbi:MAG: glycosyltransferase family 2 protein [Verrucomicrobiota bacterium]|nr:glycosyltransferase family 2 protein [Verrucomicrobiota bacterium]
MQINNCIIPAYNEENHIGAVISVAAQFVQKIYVVDDGSSDRTEQIAEQAGAVVIRLKKRIGKGYALREGIRHALAGGADNLILMDADAQHDPHDIPLFLKESIDFPQSMIIGNRMGSATSMPLARRLTNRLMSMILSRISRKRLSDSQCGFRLIPAGLAQQWSLESNYFEIESEMILKAAALGWDIHQMPVSCSYRHGRQSRIMPLLDSWRWLRFIMRGVLSKAR